MVFRRAAVRGILEQEIGHSGRTRRCLFVHLNLHDYSIYAEWLGSVCRRIPRDDRNRCFPDEGSGSPCRV